MKSIPSLAFLALLVAQAPAQQQDVQNAWQQFLAENGDAWGVKWNLATSTPDAIYGKGLRVAEGLGTLEAASTAATKLLRKYGKLLNVGASTPVETYSGTVRHLHYFTYKQTFKGLDVRDARADFRINKNGVVAMFGSSFVAIPQNFGINPVLTAVAARRIAENNILGKKGLAGRATKLIIFAEPYGDKITVPRLAWEVEINELPGQLAAGRSYIDALNGDVLFWQNDIVYCASCGKNHMPKTPAERRLEKARTARALAEYEAANMPAPKPKSPMNTISGTVMAWTNTDHSPNTALVNIPLKNLQVTSSAGNAFTDDKGKFSIPYTGTGNVVVTAVLGGKYQKRITVRSGTQMTATASIAKNVPGTIQFGTKSMGDQDRSQTTVYHFTDDVYTYVKKLVPGNATQWARLAQVQPIVNINSSCNAYYTNNTINFFNASGTCNMTAYEGVVQHEWGHALDDAFGRIVFTDGLSEGWADVITILRSEQPIIGPNFYKSRTPNYVRIATNTARYPVSGGTHAKGQVWMGWVWDVKTDLAKTKGNTVAQIITERIVIPTIVANSPNLEKQILECFILDDDDSNLANGTPNYVQLERACIKRNIKYPKVDTGYITHTPLEGSKDQLTARPVFAKAIPISGRFVKVELFYDIGAGTQVREMVPTGKKDEYVGLLPGVRSPNTVKYWILGTHSVINKTHRSPQAGSYTYAIGEETRFFSDDFEGSNKGWSKGVRSGTANDWTIGTPSGLGGTSWNQGWRDPKGAYSGTKVWGNNVAGPYSANMDAYLRSPKLDLTGKTNVFLRFQRWLQVQESKYDTARILLNGKLVWENDWNAHTVDGQWFKTDIRLAGADNNKSVELEWTMTTDGGMELAGWNIDDVLLYSFKKLPAPKVELTFNPPQINLGKQSTVTIKGTANAPILILVSSAAGPTKIPGLPTLRVGTPFVTAPAKLNASGQLSFNFTAPTGSGNTGKLVYVHILERSGSTVNASNAGVLLWGK